MFNAPYSGAAPTGPNRMFWVDYYAGVDGAANSSYNAADADGIASLMATMDAASPQRVATTGLRLSAPGLEATPDPFNFSGGRLGAAGALPAPRWELARLSAALLNQRDRFRESLYGALLPSAEGSYFPSLRAGTVSSSRVATFTILREYGG